MKPQLIIWSECEKASGPELEWSRKNATPAPLNAPESLNITSPLSSPILLSVSAQSNNSRKGKKHGIRLFQVFLKACEKAFNDIPSGAFRNVYKNNRTISMFDYLN
jgi:hypothetical protein